MRKHCHKHLELLQFTHRLNRNMKKVLFCLSFILFSQLITAQLFSKERIKNNVDNIDQQLLSWGYFIGFNSNDFNFDYENDIADVQVIKSTGFNVGLIGNLRINRFLDLRIEPGLSVNTRELNFSPANFVGLDFDERDLIREVQSTYIHIPLLLKFSTKRLNNFKPFIIGGFSTAFNLSSNEDNLDDNSAGQFRTTTNVFFYELGIGIDFYFPWFKFSPSIRGIFGLGDELVRDEDPNSPWTGNIESLQTRGIFVNITIQ